MAENIIHKNIIGQYFNDMISYLEKTVHVSIEENPQYYRERLFMSVFMPLVILGILVLIPSIILCIKLEAWDLVTLDITIYILAACITFIRKIPFGIRVIAGMMIVYLLGIILLFLNGPSGAGMVWLFMFAVLVGLLMGAKWAMYSLFLNIISLASIGVLMYEGLIYWEFTPSYSLGMWTVQCINFLFCNAVVSISLALLFQRLQNNLENEESISASLNQERIRLLNLSEKLDNEIKGKEKAEKEKINLERQLIQAQKLESIGTLAGGIAHDFNNILYPIIGFTELAIPETHKDSLISKYLNEILIAAKRAKNLVLQIIRFSRMETPGNEPLLVQDILREAIALIRASIPSSIIISEDIDDSCGPITGDATQIHQVILNLCTNAYHAMEKTGGRMEISLKMMDRVSDENIKRLNLSDSKYMVLIIGDTGTGIDPAIMGKIFDPYFSTKGYGKGTGLGLSVVHGIVKSHGGNIHVESKLGKGSKFYIYLPFLEKDLDITFNIPQSVDTVPKGEERILVVDDETQITNLVKQVLERVGYQVKAYNSSAEALSVFQSDPDVFDLVISDITMPVIDGLELVKKLKGIRIGIPVILCSGFYEKIPDDKIESLGIQGFAMKPIAKADLITLVRNALDEVG